MNDERKPRFHIHFGALIILIIVIIIILNIDFKKIKDQGLPAEVNNIVNLAKDAFNQYILNPVKIKTNEVFVDTTNKGLKQIQDNFSNNVLKPVEVNQ